MKHRAEKKQASQRKKINADFSVILIGGSAGSFHALLTLLHSLPEKLNAAVCVVMHLASNSNVTYLIQHLQQSTSLKCRLASDGDPIASGSLYLAGPNVHMLLSEQRILFGDGPDENRFKPSIDVLLRSAAVEFRERTIGIILSGLLDDGVAGMMAIKECGGICVVQDPTDAEYGALPIAVLKKLDADHVLPVADMGTVLTRLINQKRKPVRKIPKALADEAAVAEKMLTEIDDTRKLGTQSLFTCPDCGGTLFHIQDRGLSRYRCFTGHAYSENGLVEKQNESLLVTLWTSIRMFEERRKLLEKMPKTTSIHKRLLDLNQHISILKNLLADIQKLSANPNE
jgi:two-component system chemotaxis response regulator CheB